MLLNNYNTREETFTYMNKQISVKNKEHFDHLMRSNMI